MSLLTRFAVVSLVPVVLFGAVLGGAVRRSIEHRALDVYTAESEVVLNMLVRTLLAEGDFDAPMAPERADVLQGLLAQIPAPEPVDAVVRLVNHDGLVVFSTDDAEIGTTVDPEPLAPALAGTSSSRFDGSVEADDGTYRLLRLHQPVRLVAGGEVLGAVEVVAPDTTVAPTISDDVRRIQLVLAGGLAALWLSLLPIVGRAASALRRQADEHEYHALHDGLTGLPNRNLFEDRLGQAMMAARRSGQRGALVVLDLDGFKDVNDSLGHHHGDSVLQHAATALRSALRDSDTVARLGGDEFGIVLPGVENAQAVAAVAERLARDVERPVAVDGVTVVVGASVGAALFPDHGDDVALLLQRADAAMYAAKKRGVVFQLYSEVKESSGRSRAEMVAGLREAVATGDGLALYYQPRVTVDGRPEGMEAFLRWHHPTAGLVAPMDYLTPAEQSGLVRDLSMRVLDLAMEDCRGWLDHGVPLWVAVSLPVRNLREADLPERVGRLLGGHRLPPSHLVIGTTEAALLVAPGPAVDVLSRLRSLGIGIELDGFGTGFSSFQRLKDVPADHVRMDRGSFAHLEAGEADASIVRSVIALAHDLGMRVTADGVATADEHARLAALDCDLVQGPFVADAMPGPEVVTWARRRTAPSAGPGPRGRPATGR